MPKVELEETIIEETELDTETNLEEDEESAIDSENSSEEEAGETEEEVEDIIISIDGESPPQEEEEIKEAPTWVKELRKSNREIQKENRALKAKLEETEKTETKPVTLRAKPTIENSDFDPEVFEKDLDVWYVEKKIYDEEQDNINASKQKEADDWQSSLDSYAESKKNLKAKDFDELEHVVTESLNVTQQGIIIQGAENKALVVVALGRNPKKLEELKQIKDPIKFAMAVGRLEKQMKVTNRKAATKPEASISGKSGVTVSSDTHLDKLRKDAERTGNYSKIHSYKQKLREKK